jgi:hypothetical protein
MSEIIVLGFDARKSLAHQSSIWTDERRSKFLIRPEVESPVSVDRTAWPALGLNPDESYPLYLWGSVSEVLEAFPELAQSRSNSPLIVEVAVAATADQLYWEGIIFGRLSPRFDGGLDIAAECLGYDVADRYCVSGLSNCMLSAEELAGLRKDWAGAINAWGLIGDIDAAKVFRGVCDRLIPEHSPFEAYRVRRISVGAAG